MNISLIVCLPFFWPDNSVSGNISAFHVSGISDITVISAFSTLPLSRVARFRCSDHGHRSIWNLPDYGCRKLLSEEHALSFSKPGDRFGKRVSSVGTSSCAHTCSFTKSVISNSIYSTAPVLGVTPRPDLSIKGGIRPIHDYFYQPVLSRIGASEMHVQLVLNQTTGQGASERIDHENRECVLLLILLRGRCATAMESSELRDRNGSAAAHIGARS